MVWSPEGYAGPAGSLASGLGVPAKVSPRPEPVLPSPRSKLLPADVRAARRAQVAHQQKMAAIAAVVVAYLGVAGWLGYGIWRDQQMIKAYKAEAASIMPPDLAADVAHHKVLWAELEPVVDYSRAPVEIMSRVAKAIPPNSGLRLKTAEINAGQIKLVGEAPQAAPVNTFSLNLSRESGNLGEYDWDTPPPSNSSKGWDFVFTGSLPDSTP